MDKPLQPPKSAPKPGAGVQTVTVKADEDGMRLDRFFEARFPGLSFSHIQRIIRKGEVRVNGKRAEPKDRIKSGQSIRVPPLKIEAPKPKDDAPQGNKDRAFIKSITLFEDDDVMVLNKPMGLSVQGGSGTYKHIDGMLDALQGKKRQRPRLVHRLDGDTSGVIVVARTVPAAASLSEALRHRDAQKIYWALTKGVPKPHRGVIKLALAKESGFGRQGQDERMAPAEADEEGAKSATTYYAVMGTAADAYAWVALKPITGRTHQLRVHCQAMGWPILGDPIYGDGRETGEMLHLHARAIEVPLYKNKAPIKAAAPVPAHMRDLLRACGLNLEPGTGD